MTVPLKGNGATQPYNTGAKDGNISFYIRALRHLFILIRGDISQNAYIQGGVQTIEVE